MEKRTPKTKEEAREYAIDWQNWASEHSLSWADIAEWSGIFTYWGTKFDLLEEFKENGII